MLRRNASAGLVRRYVVLVMPVLLALGSCSDATAPPVPTTVSVSTAVATLGAIGETVQLSASVKDQAGRTMQGVPVAWTTSDAAVASVSSSGVVTGIANGSTTITASAGAASGRSTVNVQQVPAAVLLSTPTLSLAAIGDTGTLGATVLDSRGHSVVGATVQWTSSSTSVATVSTAGLVTAVANGSATITASSGTVSDGTQVHIEQTVHSLRLSSTSVELSALTDTLRLRADVLDHNGHVITTAAVQWSSADSSVATVTSAGVITANANGSTTITARSGELSGSADVRVQQVASTLEFSRRNHSFTTIGDTVRLAATVRDARGHLVAGAVPVWTSSDPTVASVGQDGLVTAAGTGTTNVNATVGHAAETAFIRVDNPLQLVVKHAVVHEFIDHRQSPPYEYAGVHYPGGPMSYFPQGTTVYELWRDGRPDVFAPLMMGYATGLDTRMKPLFFRNMNGVLVEATAQVDVPAIPGVRRLARLDLPNDPFTGLFAVQHDTHDGRMGDALLVAAGATPYDATSRIAPLPLAGVFGRNTAVNAHSMAGGDLSGNGRTDFVVGDWGDFSNPCEQCGPYFLVQQTDGRWAVRLDPVLRHLTFDQPMLHAGVGEGHNLLIDLHLADVDGDGLADVIAGYGHGSATSWVYFNQGDGRLSLDAKRALPPGPYGVNNSMHVKTYSLDINGDGALDLVIIYTRFQPYYGGYAFQILINDGTGSFRDESRARMRSLQENEAPNSRLSWSDHFQFIDVNGDGQLDLIGGHGRGDGWDGRVRVWLNSGGYFNEIPVATETPFRAIPLGWADFGSGRIGTLGMETSWTDAAGSAVRVWFTQYEFDRDIR
jgi:uncharacterized protein YjdB